jgi:hypothetical protein
MAVHNRILSTSLATGVVDWFRANFFYNVDGIKRYYIHPKNMFNYVNTAIPLPQMPALSVYTTKNNITTNYWKEQGKVHLDVIFNTNQQLANLSKQFNEVLSAIRAQLLSNPVYITDFLANYSPGLQLLPTMTETDMSKYKQAMDRKESSYVHSFELNYIIDIYLNQKAVWESGRDYFSPIDEIYTDLETETQLLIIPYEGNQL